MSNTQSSAKHQPEQLEQARRLLNQYGFERAVSYLFAAGRASTEPEHDDTVRALADLMRHFAFEENPENTHLFEAARAAIDKPPETQHERDPR